MEILQSLNLQLLASLVKELIDLGVSGTHAQTATLKDSLVNPKWVRFDKIQ